MTKFNINLHESICFLLDALDLVENYIAVIHNLEKQKELEIQAH